MDIKEILKEPETLLYWFEQVPGLVNKDGETVYIKIKQITTINHCIQIQRYKEYALIAAFTPENLNNIYTEYELLQSFIKDTGAKLEKVYYPCSC